MAKLKPSLKLNLDILDEDGQTTQTFNVTYRELTRKQTRSINEESKDILELFNESQSTAKRIESLENKIDALKELDNSKEIVKFTTQLDKLYLVQDKQEVTFNKLGGLDALLDATKATFNLAIGGKDKKALVDFIEENTDYATVLDALTEDAKEQMGK